MRLKDKIAIVTGSASGLGRAMAKRFAQEGASVVIADINKEGIDAVVAEVQAAGGKASGYKVDVAKRAEVTQFMKAVHDQYGRIDILVNNAGVNCLKPFLAMNEEDWDFVLSVDLKGVFFCSQAIAEIMMKQKSGKILNIASPQGNGGAPPGGDKTNYPYGSAKAGVIQMTKTLARELGGYGINVNCMAPSTVEMRMLSSNLTPQEAGAFAEMRKKGNVLGRLALPVEIANAALFLVSDESSFVSGQLLRVDGGRTDYM